MAFADLHEHVQQTFAEFMGYEEHEAQLTVWCHMRRAAQAEVQSDRALYFRHYYRKRKPLLQARRASSRPPKRRLRGADSCGRCIEPRAPGCQLCDRHLRADRERKKTGFAPRSPESVRAYWRQRKAKQRARLKAEARRAA